MSFASFDAGLSLSIAVGLILAKLLPDLFSLAAGAVRGKR